MKFKRDYKRLTLSILIGACLSPYHVLAEQYDQGFIPRNKASTEYVINMRDLYKQKVIEGDWSVNSGRIRVDVKNGCKVSQSGVHNYFSSSGSSDDPLMRINPEAGLVAENRFLKIYLSSEIGTHSRLASLPWINEPGDGSEGYRCSLLTSWGIYTAQKGKYKIELKRPFSMDEQFNNYTAYIFGGRAIDTNDTPPIISIMRGDEIAEVKFKFTDWFSPYTCSLTQLNPVIDFGPHTPKEIIAGVNPEYMTLNLSCTTKDEELNYLATQVVFIDTNTREGSQYFNTINPDTNKEIPGLVFQVKDLEHSNFVKNLTPISTKLIKANSNEANKVLKFEVSPKWIGAGENDIPVGRYKSSGIILFTLE